MGKGVLGFFSPISKAAADVQRHTAAAEWRDEQKDWKQQSDEKLLWVAHQRREKKKKADRERIARKRAEEKVQHHRVSFNFVVAFCILSWCLT
jgi:hypothetical protein